MAAREAAHLNPLAHRSRHDQSKDRLQKCRWVCLQTTLEQNPQGNKGVRPIMDTYGYIWQAKSITLSKVVVKLPKRIC